jgi:mRNA-degrading endonuclease toxin of MazEF toxin-antitoxin module
MRLPEPQPGMVIRYAYLWRNEAEQGRDHGSKDRPCVVVLAVKKEAARTRVVVAPITHRAPAIDAGAIPLSSLAKARLGLDEDTSWIVTNDLNAFDWPGPDLRPLNPAGETPRFTYGYLSADMTRRLIECVRDHVRRKSTSLTPRHG